jgi:hypothetical protein
VPEQQGWPAGQQALPQQGWLQQTPLQQNWFGPQHVSPQQVWLSVQHTPPQQAPEQQSPGWAQTPPSTPRHRSVPPAGQHCRPSGQLSALQAHCPGNGSPQNSPGGQEPQLPPQPSSPQVLPAQSGVQTHCPWAVHTLGLSQITHRAPLSPQKVGWLERQRPGLPGPLEQQPSGQLPGVQRHVRWVASQIWPSLALQERQSSPSLPQAAFVVPGWQR